MTPTRGLEVVVGAKLKLGLLEAMKRAVPKHETTQMVSSRARQSMARPSELKKAHCSNEVC
jgi:hypothetical protein